MSSAVPIPMQFTDSKGNLSETGLRAWYKVAELLGAVQSGVLPQTFTLTIPGGATYGIVYLAGDGVASATGALTDGQVLIGRTGDAPTPATLTGTTNQITVTNGAGSITLSLPQDIHAAASPTFSDITLSALTVGAFLYSGTSSLVSSTAAATNGQLLIGSTGANPVAASLSGTANQVNVTNGAGSITLSLPQDIHTSAAPTFASMTVSDLTANSFAYSGAGGALTSAGAPTNGQLLIGSTGAAPVRATLTGTANQITVTNSAGGITLSTPQNIATTSNVTFGSITSTGAFGCNGKTAQTAAAVNAAISATAGAAYTGTEQTMINDLKALVNQLRTALVNNGVAV